jgi:hypothetical protein
MRHTLFAILAVLFTAWHAQCQIVADTFYIPNYPIPEIYYTDEAPELPDSVWNQQSEYFPPWFYCQPLADCGQASGLFYSLSYEFNRLLDRPADSTSIFSPLYSYNFLNEGNGWYGVSTFDSWNLAKSQGNMMLSEFNQLRKLEVIDHKNLKGYQGQYWIDGYNYYYEAMKYRIKDYYSLNVKTEEDLKILMHYFNDHLRGDESGGCAIIYCNNHFEHYGPILGVIFDLLLNPTEANTRVINSIAGEPGHSLTVTGYYNNTSLDFNSDGFISDSIDINGDEIVDMHDNEKVMWIVVNSRGDGWTHSHFLFTYDLLLQVWNQQVFLPVPDTSYSPALTFKIKLKHPCRNAIKISAGISTDLDSNIPERIIDFPIFNFQGGTHGMKGVDTMPDPDVLEFGIDVTDILKKLDISRDVKVFMKIDNAGYEQGELQYFSIIKYDEEIPDEHIVVSDPTQISGTSETYFSQIINLESNSETELLNFDFQVDSEFYTNDTNSLILIPVGGTPPYKFRINKTNEFSQQLAISEYSDEYISVWDSVEYKIVVPNHPIEFAGESYDSVIINGNGTVSFAGKKFIYPDRYPYEFNPSSYYKNMELDVFSGYRYRQNVKTATQVSDSCIRVFWNNSKMAKFKAMTEIYHNGIIKTIYFDTTFNNTHRTAGIKTYTGTYYCELEPSGISETYNTVIYHPVDLENTFYINENSELVMLPTSYSGDYTTYVVLEDATGERITRRISLNIINNRIDSDSQGNILKLFPNPFSTDAEISINSEKEEIVNLEIFDNQGKIVSKTYHELKTGENCIKVSASKYGLKQGVYIGRIFIKGKYETLKFTVI